VHVIVLKALGAFNIVFADLAICLTWLAKLVFFVDSSSCFLAFGAIHFQWSGFAIGGESIDIALLQIMDIGLLDMII